jgi:diguanylate cyclase (GGDEF)-like protein
MDLVAVELGGVFGADGTGVLRVDPQGHTVVVGSWSVPGAPRMPPGSSFETSTYTELLKLLDAGHAITSYGPMGPTEVHGYVGRVIAPVRLGGRLWGAVTVAGMTPDAVPDGETARIERFAELVSLAIGNAETRAALHAQATTDPLTGLVNHRAFHERLHIEADRARRHGRSLSVAVFDVDHFKAINDGRGHLVGDEVLRGVATALRSSVRRGDVVGRLGGDEIAVLQPETDAEGAEAMAENVRALVAGAPVAGVTLTISAGVCDLSNAGGDPERMLSLADGALYWAKFQGRDACVRYSPDVVEELSASERAERLQRSQAMAGLRGLARAIDAKDHLTHSHAERVADLAVALARAAGWSDARVTKMRDAALLHDVGKIGVPDSILAKPHGLTSYEYEIVKTHASLSAEIASEVLDAEQVSWIRGHHERPDGLGYPDRLAGEDVPEGASLLALADAWDSMTSARSYSPAIKVDAALDQCRTERGRQFSRLAVDALETLAAEGALEHAAEHRAAA